MERLKDFLTVDPAVARSALARALLDTGFNMQPVGEIDLQPHQISGVARIRTTIAEFGGVILCDPVGTGKTYTALAVPDEGERILVVAPAVLRPMWTLAAEKTHRSVEFLSIESLSRGRTSEATFDFLIIDEAHHVRTASTRRYRLVAALASRMHTLLLTATPIHNRRTDLMALVALFLGERSKMLTKNELGRVIINRSSLTQSIPGIPAIDELIWCSIPVSSEVLDTLLSIPPPVPPSDGGDGGALVLYSLVRQWSSSNAALIAGLRRRLVRAEALIAALGEGTWPSRMELQSWIAGDDAIQLSFGGFLASPSEDTAQLRDSVLLHRDGLTHAMSVCRSQNSDHHRADLIRRIRNDHPDRRVVVFSQYTDTIEGLYALLARDGGVAALSGSGAVVTGGRISRTTAIRSFAPQANGGASVARANAITLLLTTDLLSEGVNLQDAGVVVHLDLPWTPARMEQRVGRVARIGSAYRRVMSYAISPPAASHDIVRIEAILRSKIAESAAVGDGFLSLGMMGRLHRETSIPAITESIRSYVEKWVDPNHGREHPRFVATAVESCTDGFVAVCVDDTHSFLVGGSTDVITDDPSVVQSLLPLCDGPPADAHAAVALAHDRLSAWLYSRSASSDVRDTSGATMVRHAAMRRIDLAARRARPHLRAGTARLARTARAVVTGMKGAHLDQKISELCRSDVDDLELLKRIAELTPLVRDAATGSVPVILGLIVLVKTRPLSEETER